MFFFGNKVSWGEEKWNYSGELQIRLQDYGQSLDNWYMEGVASYMPSKNWEIVPDFRISIHPEQVEYRPGFGVLRKDLFHSEKIILSGLGGVFYSWKEHFTGLEYIRGGAGVAYVFNIQHALNLIYLVGAANLGNSWIYQGNLILQHHL